MNASAVFSEESQICRIFGRVTGNNEIRHLIFCAGAVRRDVWVRHGRYHADLPPGRYQVSHLTFSNVTWPIEEIEIGQSGEFDLHYDSPRMRVRVRNLPADVQSGEVNLRSARGCSSRQVVGLAQFDLNFEGNPDLHPEAFHHLEIRAGYRDRRFQFKAQAGGTLEIDFSAPESV